MAIGSNGTTNGAVDGLAQARALAIPNPLKERMQAGQLTHSFSLKMVDTIEIVHMIAQGGYDAVLLDLEHSSFSLDTASKLSCAALQVGITPIVRVPANTSDWISRALDGGAQAVVVPHVNSAAEARNVVKYATFAPMGERSATGCMPAFRYNSVHAKYANVVANEKVVVMVMIETERALENLDEIAAVEGVDVLLIGSADLTADMGIPNDFDSPRMAEAYAKVAAACEKASVNGRLVTMGMGGINSRPDLIEKFAAKHKIARYAFSGADNTLLFSGIKKLGGSFVEMTGRICQ